jgi:glutathione S-transferase
MKLLESKTAPNPRRVRIFLAEKGVTVPDVQIDIASAETRGEAFLAKNPMAGVPVLELDDGRYLSESVAICRYFEGLHPDPPLMGVDATDAAFVEMWNRRMELELMNNITAPFRHSHEFFKGRITQVPAWGEACRADAEKRLDWLDGELADREFVAGDRYSIADITALCAIDFGRVAKIRIDPGQKNLQRWHEAVSSRPSAAA